MLKHVTKKYKGFTIVINVDYQIIRAFWTDGDMEKFQRFSGYSINEILDIVKWEIDTMELSA